jgi:Flp pilus assembly pilin Flp
MRGPPRRIARSSPVFVNEDPGADLAGEVDDLGATSVEYALLAAFIAAAAAAAFLGFGSMVLSLFEQGKGAFP